MPKIISEETKQQAFNLRQQGMSYKEISEVLPVSANWCKLHLKEQKKASTFQLLTGKFCVYLFYCSRGDNRCLYVGSTTNFKQRLLEHKSGSSFYINAEYVYIFTYETYSEMVFNEAEFIIDKQPLYNVSITKHKQRSKYCVPNTALFKYYIENDELVGATIEPDLSITILK
jgi:predicted GIY-YIG superfamily endonuclease